MKKYLQTLLLLVAFVLPFGLQAQTLLSEGFEGGVCPPAGWTMVYANAGHPSGNDMILSSAYAHGGSYSFRFSSFSSGSPYDQYLISPALELTSGALVNFYYANFSSGTESFQVGYSTTDSLLTSFTWGDGYSAYSGAGWQLAEDLIPANARYVAIHYYSNYAYYLYVDDFTIESNSCPKPMNLRTSYVTVDSAIITWTEMGTATSWVVEYSDTQFTPGAGEATVEYTSDTMLVLAGLDTGTTYYVAIHADCGSGDTSANNTFSFTTLASLPTYIPYFCDFEDEGNNGWAFFNGTQPTYWMVGTGTASTGSKSMYLTGNGTSYGYGSGSSAVYAYRDIVFPETGEYAITYDWKCEGENGSHNYDYLRIFLAPGGTELTAGSFPFGTSSCYDYANMAAPNGYYDLTGERGPYTLSGASDFVNNIVFANIPAGTYRLFFTWTDDNTYMNPAAVDNIGIRLNTCPMPTNLRDSNNVVDGFDLLWNPGGDETEWEVTIDDSIVVTVTNPYYSVTGLPSSSMHSVRVRAICSAEDTSFATRGIFQTECDVISELPFVENFNNYSNGSKPICWSCYYAGGDYPQIATYAGSPALYYYKYTSGPGLDYMLTSLPAIDTLTYPIRNLTVSFDGMVTSSSVASYNYYQTDVIVGVCGTAGDLSTFVPVDTILNVPYNNGQMTSFDINLASYADTGRYITFVAKNNDASTYSYGYIYLALDNITIMESPSCFRPENLAVTRVWGDTVELAWTDSLGSSWELVYGEHGIDPDTVSFGIISNIYDDSIQLTGLSLGQQYDFYVRTDCGGDYSAWRGPISAVPAFTYNMPTSGLVSVTGCGLIIYDDGGPDAGYSNYADGTMVVYPASPDSLVRIYGHFNGESCCDYLYIYDGVGTSGTQLHYGIGSGATSIIDTLTSTSGPLTIRFTSDVSGCGAGDLVLYVSCVEAPECGNVQNLAVQAGSVSAMATWTPSIVGEPASYDVSYRELGEEDWTDTNVATPYCAITGLTINTEYELRVATNCTEGVSIWVVDTFLTKRCLTGGDIVMGEGIDQTSGVPVNSGWGNSICQSIFTADELVAQGLHAGNISSLKYTWTAGGTYNKEFTIRMGTTTQSVYTSASYIPVTNQTRVYSGVRPAGTSGTVEYTFTEPFVWDGTSNIVVTTYMNQYGGSQSSSGFYGLSTNISSNRTVYGYQDSNPIDTTGTNPSYSYVSQSRPSVIFGSLCDSTNTCAAPVLAVGVVTTNSVELAWAPGNEETSWNVYGKTASEANFTLLANNVSVNHYVATGLRSGTPYQFKVESGCSADAYALVETVTECAALSSLPYTENFNDWGTGTGTIPRCWYRTGSYSDYGFISSDYNHSGTTGGAYYTYASNGASYHTFMILPELDTNIYSANNCQLVFNALNDDPSYYDVDYAVGVMTDPYDITSFVAVDTVHVSSGSWELFEVPLSNYTGNGAHVAVKAVYVTDYGYGYIDDVVLETIPTCPRPDSLMAANATSNSVDLSWHERGGANEWVIEYGPVGFTLGTGTTITATSNPFTLTGLTPSYDGEYYVRSVCSITDTGYYSYQPCRFSTSQVPAAIPYNYNFEDAAEWANWQTNSNSDINWYRGNADAGDGSYSMYISADEGATVGNNGFSSTVNASAYRDIDFGTVDSSFTFTFKAKVGGTVSAAYDALMVFLVDPSVPVVAPTGNITSPWGSVNDLYRIATARLDTTWNTYTASFDNISGVKRVAFFWFNQNTASSYPFIGGPAEVDSISIDYSNCPRPTDLEVVSTGASSATVTWRGPASASYEIVYRPYPNGTANTTVYSNTNSYTFTGLESLTQYAFWVRKICGADSSLYSDGLLFTTALCDGAVYAYNYDSTSTFTTTDYIPAYAYYNYGASQTIIDSADLAVLDGAEISAFAFTTNSGTNGEYYTDCEVYLMHTTLSEFSSGTPVDLDSAVLVYQGDLTFSDAGVQMFGFDTTFVWDGHSNVILTILRHHGSYGSSSSYVFEAVEKASDKGLYAYSDSYDPVAPSLTSYSGSFYTTNVVAAYQLIACGAGCPIPVITSTLPTYNSVDVTWSSNATNFEISYKSVSDADFTTPVAVAASNYTLTGLTPATQYTFRVRSLCDSGAVSDWASVNFVTDSLPCFAPEDLHQTAITYTSVTLDWTNGGNEQNWVVKVFNSRIGEILDTVSAHPATITGLTANEQYFATVQAACGSTLDGFSEWSDTISFTTSECVAVSNISCATPTNSSVEISWTSNGSESAWIVEYGMPGFGQGEELGRATATSNPYQLSLAGLDPNTTYEVYVYAQCMEGLTSVPAGPASFTTNDIGISGISGNADINIYPNPTTGSTTISVNGISGKVNVAIVDMNGREVMSSAMECDGDCEKVMNVEGLAQGAYFVRIYGEEINSIRKLIVR